MEAATLQKKKTVNKGKIKKTLKNVLCRPDPVFWPVISDSQKMELESTLNKYSLEIPEFKKPHWKELKNIPKEKRPKAPKIEKIEGLFFGISECLNAITNNNCTAVIVEASVNPQAIVQPVIEACIAFKVPVICMHGLRTSSTSNFGISTCCLGINSDNLQDLHARVVEISKSFKTPQIAKTVDTECIDMEDVAKVKKPILETTPIPTDCPYLYRTSKKVRIFNPSEGTETQKNIADFSDQDFIELSEKKDISNTENMDRKSYMKMVLKKISNNPNRIKLK